MSDFPPVRAATACEEAAGFQQSWIEESRKTAALTSLQERAEKAERERDAWRHTAEDAHKQIDRLGAGNLSFAADVATLSALVSELVEALTIARKHVLSQNRAEGMLEGLCGRKPRKSDADLAAIDAAIEKVKKAGLAG